jgi:hypothetical protein
MTHVITCWRVQDVMFYVESGGVGYVRLRWGLEGFVVMVMVMVRVRPGENSIHGIRGFS